MVLPLGFRFDVDAVLVDGVAHRRDCERLSDPRPERALSVPAAGIYVAERCPRACGRCRPGFETLLRYQFDATGGDRHGLINALVAGDTFALSQTGITRPHSAHTRRAPKGATERRVPVYA